MTLGVVQEGTEDTRLKKLKESIAIKDRESAKNIAKEKDSSASPASPGAKTNYPILGKLETKVLKKTFVGESIDQRLDRLEKQVFGVPAEAMSYIDRIDRLKKTTGLDAPVIASLPPAGPGGVIRNNAPNSRIWSVPHAMRTYPNADRLNKSLPPGATFRRFTNPDGSSGFVYQYRSDGTVPNLPGPDMSLQGADIVYPGIHSGEMSGFPARSDSSATSVRSGAAQALALAWQVFRYPHPGRPLCFSSFANICR